MEVKNILRFILFPFAGLYGLGILVRNQLFRWGVLKETTFQFPIINVGNLSMGGTGKTPHIEYLLNLLTPYLNVATLSRGYKRKTTGFLEVSTKHKALEIGDEPLQLKLKHQETKVFVGEDRVLSIPLILQTYPDVQTILLDDAFQHRAIKPSLNILLTPYSDLYIDDFLLPVGRLREFRSGAKRADVIIVTKCPQELTSQDKDEVKQKLNTTASVFFSRVQYLPVYNPFEKSFSLPTKNTDVILITGIAKNEQIMEYAKKNYNQFRIMNFPDHYVFTKNDMAKLVERYQKMDSQDKAIVTTEKDLVRLFEHGDYILQNHLPIFVLPIQINFMEEKDLFESFIKDFLLNFKV